MKFFFFIKKNFYFRSYFDIRFFIIYPLKLTRALCLKNVSRVRRNCTLFVAVKRDFSSRENTRRLVHEYLKRFHINWCRGQIRKDKGKQKEEKSIFGSELYCQVTFQENISLSIFILNKGSSVVSIVKWSP